MTTIAGTTQGFSGDGGPANVARLDRPADVKVDASGNIYIADMNNHRIRRVDASGTITTVAGDGVPVRGPDGVPALRSSLSTPSGLAIGPDGDLFVVDWGNYLVRGISFRGSPAIVSNGVLNAASFAPGPLAPGSLFTIFGAGLAAGDAQADRVPWPASLAGTSVSVNGVVAPVYFVSAGQINAQLPYAITEGEAAVTVTTARGPSPPEFVAVSPTGVGVFTFPSTNRAIALNQDNSVNGESNAEARGRVLTVFVTGTGAVSPEMATGEAASFDQLHRANAAITATLGGIDAPVQFFGLTPGFVGLAQVNVLIPEGVASGAEASLSLRTAGQAANQTVVSVR